MKIRLNRNRKMHRFFYKFFRCLQQKSEICPIKRGLDEDYLWDCTSSDKYEYENEILDFETRVFLENEL